MDQFGYFWENGTGKTFVATLHSLLRQERIGSQTIVVAPVTLHKHWQTWLSECGIRSIIHEDGLHHRTALALNADIPFTIMSMEVLKADFEWMQDQLWGKKITLIVDQVPGIKKVTSANFEIVKKISEDQGILILQADPFDTPADAYAYGKLLTSPVYRSFSQFANIHIGKHSAQTIEWKGVDHLRSVLMPHYFSFVQSRLINKNYSSMHLDVESIDASKFLEKQFKFLTAQEIPISMGFLSKRIICEMVAEQVIRVDVDEQVDDKQRLIALNSPNIGDGQKEMSDIATMQNAINLLKNNPTQFASEIRELRAYFDSFSGSSADQKNIIEISVTETVLTFSEVIHWLTKQETIDMSEIRRRLLPLDLFPNAVIDDINERALNLTGETALTEFGDKVVVTRKIFDQVLAAWDDI